MNYRDDCIFCQIGRKEIASAIVYEDDEVLAFLDVSPVTKGHTLVITKEHFKNFTEVPKSLISRVFAVAQLIAQAQISELHASGCNILTNVNEVAGQSVMHFHVHIIPRYDDTDGLTLNFAPKSIGTFNLPIVAGELKKGL